MAAAAFESEYFVLFFEFGPHSTFSNYPPDIQEKLRKSSQLT